MALSPGIFFSIHMPLTPSTTNNGAIPDFNDFPLGSYEEYEPVFDGSLKTFIRNNYFNV